MGIEFTPPETLSCQLVPSHPSLRSKDVKFEATSLKPEPGSIICVPPPVFMEQLSVGEHNDWRCCRYYTRQQCDRK
ncbi:hypothetical protein AG1IA_09333 [Rhizoctonia solani AG-1 IA]|uniref:Uncharacterized protein n=1 Tax=Thanatephorus cucumeris (strain AG1-IA) TaxID=983506 RepID=L8WEL5_THACA|nr:hypothetical protein AG1IA_09333 [Rhizoctonia solani AG-1 IA]